MKPAAKIALGVGVSLIAIQFVRRARNGGSATALITVDPAIGKKACGLSTKHEWARKKIGRSME